MNERYTIYNTKTQTADATNRAIDPALVVNLDPALVLLLEVDGDAPEFDEATHRLGAWGERVYDVEAGTATRTRALTPRDPREVKRAAMADNFRTLPAWLRGAFYPQFMAATQLLDAGDDEAAIALVADADPNEKTKGTSGRPAIFTQVKADYITAIQALSE